MLMEGGTALGTWTFTHLIPSHLLYIGQLIFTTVPFCHLLPLVIKRITNTAEHLGFSRIMEQLCVSTG